jgi:sugar transferase (PEP-CTERM/EpsH1 system associated)
MLVSRIPWPLEKGDKLRAYHQLKCLAENHEVHLCCLSDSSIHPDAIVELKKITPHVHIISLNRMMIFWRMFRALFSDKPFQVHYFFQTAAQRKVIKLIQSVQPDHIYCQLIRTSEYVKNLHGFRKTIDYMDALSAGYQRRIKTAPWWQKPFVSEETRRLKNYEHLIFDYFEHQTIISEQDQQLILHPDRKKIVVIPNGIDAEFFSNHHPKPHYDLVFTGNMSYPPNVDCSIRIALHILPIIHKTRPDIKLLIAGANPSSEVRALASSHVKVSGWMDDIREAYISSKVFIAPMRTGSGLQNKLLEAMCMNLACITTPIAANAMKAIHQKHMLIGESDEEIAAFALNLLQDENLRTSMSTEGRNFASAHFNWRKSVETLVKVIELR